MSKTLTVAARSSVFCCGMTGRFAGTHLSCTDGEAASQTVYVFHEDGVRGLGDWVMLSAASEVSAGTTIRGWQSTLLHFLQIWPQEPSLLLFLRK